MSIKEFTEHYRVEPITNIVGWGVDIKYVLFDKRKGERVCHAGDVYGQFLTFKSVEEALIWASEQK